MTDKIRRIIGGLQYLGLRLLVFLSQLLKSLWLFFPSILFILLAIWCFWMLSQGQDLIVAFTENHRAKAYFLIAIGFWIYVSWFSSRIIANLKTRKQIEYLQKLLDKHPGVETSRKTDNITYFELPATWLELWPKLIGYAGLLAIEVAVLQSPALGIKPISSGDALYYFLPGLAISWGIDKMVKGFCEKERSLARKIFYAILFIFLAAGVVVTLMPEGGILLLFWALLMLHAVYLFYINLRKIDPVKPNNNPPKDSWPARMTYKVMDWLHIPRKEMGYFNWFNIICLLGLIIYLTAIYSLPAARQIGPFPFVLLAFAVLGGFGNMIAALSVKANVNFHILLVIIAFLIGSRETHWVRTKKFESNTSRGIFHKRQDVVTYFNNWIRSKGAAIDSAKGNYPVYFVLANGGASRSGYWTASVLGKLEDTTRGLPSQFSKHLFCLSGTSGGGVGVATFFSLLHEEKKLNSAQPVSYLNSARDFLKKDFLTFTLSHMLGPDYFKYIFHLNNNTLPDRAGALEQTLEEGSATIPDSLKPAMARPMSEMLSIGDTVNPLPVLCINTTRMQDGNPGVVTNIKLSRQYFNDRVDVLDVLNDTLDMRLSTASILGARFPYISPAGRIDQVIPSRNRVNQNDSMLIHYFVDGGYFDNSGAGVVQEMIRAILLSAASSKDSVLKKRVGKLDLTILHITNSPVGVAALNTIAPLKNDLQSPMLTIMGAYDMQTTVNDKRLENFLKDVSDDGVFAGTRYYPIHLYKETEEKNEARKKGNKVKETPYSMNWFISNNTLQRMDQRLGNQPSLNRLIKELTGSPN
ncbi:hypothetical protein HHL16_04850 [Pseudoflavitalea sp. G-6-1-2]|uniref:hypothetical protein n=1 Tax=Pseudoflavitalea sp. G-6-1-2 TaxID=2728841 RepID=UPI00146CF12E|nr:hypothetical protein [Pseudoflavitalea sp. G-6-1-2]NML20187.1 hypothetical protein [Pseudoflavitalea sp. G-6-1-2]